MYLVEFSYYSVKKDQMDLKSEISYSEAFTHPPMTLTFSLHPSCLL
jgi:hypothetical protein